MHTMKTVWCSIVQPHIDYCSQLWTPHRVEDIQKIMSLFRSLSSKIYPISELNFWDRLSAPKMYSRERRMERYWIIYTWKILEGITQKFWNKYKLDKYLQNTPGKQKIPGYTIETDTNFITSMRNSRQKLSNTTEAESPTWPERLYSWNN